MGGLDRVFVRRNRIKRLHRKGWSGFPGDDHVSYRNQSMSPDSPLVPTVVSQPYDLRMEEIAEMLAFAAKHRLAFWIRGHSDYNSGSTMTVIWAAEETLPWRKPAAERGPSPNV